MSWIATTEWKPFAEAICHSSLNTSCAPVSLQPPYGVGAAGKRDDPWKQLMFAMVL